MGLKAEEDSDLKLSRPASLEVKDEVSERLSRSPNLLALAENYTGKIVTAVEGQNKFYAYSAEGMNRKISGGIADDFKADFFQNKKAIESIEKMQLQKTFGNLLRPVDGSLRSGYHKKLDALNEGQGGEVVLLGVTDTKDFKNVPVYAALNEKTPNTAFAESSAFAFDTGIILNKTFLDEMAAMKNNPNAGNRSKMAGDIIMRSTLYHEQAHIQNRDVNKVISEDQSNVSAFGFKFGIGSNEQVHAAEHKAQWAGIDGVVKDYSEKNSIKNLNVEKELTGASATGEQEQMIKTLQESMGNMVNQEDQDKTGYHITGREVRARAKEQLALHEANDFNAFKALPKEQQKAYMDKTFTPEFYGAIKELNIPKAEISSRVQNLIATDAEHSMKFAKLANLEVPEKNKENTKGPKVIAKAAVAGQASALSKAVQEGDSKRLITTMLDAVVNLGKGLGTDFEKNKVAALSSAKLGKDFTIKFYEQEQKTPGIGKSPGH